MPDPAPRKAAREMADDRLLLALSMADGTLRRIHGVTLRDVLVEWGVSETWANEIDAALAKERA